MPATQEQQSGTTYLSIKQGMIRQKVAEGTPNAVLRKYTNPQTGAQGEVWELVYPGWRGIVRDINFYEGEGYENVNVVFDDVSLSMNVDSRYATDFLRKFAGADWHKEVVLTPYDFVNDEGKKRSGLTLTQGGNKLPDFFSTKNAKGEWVQKEGFPAYTGTDKDDWKMYLIQTKKFLKNWYLLHPINTIGDKETSTEERIDIDAVPF